MAIIYSYPLVSSLDSSNLFPLTATNEEDELYLANVQFSTLASEIIDEAFNGTDRYIPRFDGTSSLVNSVIYQDTDGHIGINVQPDPEHVLEVFDDRTGDPSGQHSIYLTTYSSPTPGSGSGGILARVSGDSGATFNSIAMVPGSSSSDWMTSNQTSFYANSNLDTSSATGYSGKITNDGTDAHWILGGVFNDTTNATLEVKGAGIFTDQVTIPLTPVANTDAASKGYVDAVDLDFTGNSGTGNVQQGSTFNILGSGPITTSASGTTLTINSSAAEGTGTTNTLPVWSDGPNGVLGDSGISQNLNAGKVDNVIISTPGSGGTSSDYTFNNNGFFARKQTGGVGFSFYSELNSGYYEPNFRYEGKLTVDRDGASQNPSLDVGDPDHTYPAAWFRGGVVISNNPSGVQVDNTSMVIGAGNNDNVSGSDHCLIVGSGNQITNNSNQSVAFGQLNTITGSIDSLAVGNNNSINGSQRVYALGYLNTISSGSSFVAGGQNTVGEGDTNIVIGFNNQSTGDRNFAIGNQLVSASQEMILGFRNNVSEYPATDPPNGLGEVKFVVATGGTTNVNSNALLITAGGNSGGGNPVPRVILPTVVNFNFADDTAAAAGGIPVGGLYHNAGVIRIRLT